MKFIGLYRRGQVWRQAVVECQFIQGLPQLHVLNTTNTRWRDSWMRVRTAFRSAGLKWPRAVSLVVNTEGIGSGEVIEGFDLIVATAVLLHTEQTAWTKESFANAALCARISLDGHMTAPEGALLPTLNDGLKLYTGAVAQAGCPGAWVCSNLLDWAEVQAQFQEPGEIGVCRPLWPHERWSPQAARLMAVIAAGQHPTCILGPPGVGKTTFVENLHAVLPEPNATERAEILRLQALGPSASVFRPFRAPHHTTPVRSLLGGCRPLIPGEITLAHRGILFLDELLEFHPQVQEGLREPLERGVICLSRSGESETFPADFLLVAASNLCPCGQLVPGHNVECGHSRVRCRSIYSRLSGPILDRMELVVFPSNWADPQGVTSQEIFAHVERAIRFARECRKQTDSNRRLTVAQIERTVPDFLLEGLRQRQLSSRRLRSLLRVARTLADLDGDEAIQPQHLGEASDLTERPIQQLAQLFA